MRGGWIALALIAAPPAMARDLLPLDQGIYVRSTVACASASNADTMSFWGDELNTQRATGDISEVVALGGPRYRVTTDVYDIAEDAQIGTFVWTLTIPDPRSYSLQSDQGVTNYRWCRALPNAPAAPAAPEGLPPVAGWDIARGLPYPAYAACRTENLCIFLSCPQRGQPAFEFYMTEPTPSPGDRLRLRVDLSQAELPLPATATPGLFRLSLTPAFRALLAQGKVVGLLLPRFGGEATVPLRNSAEALTSLSAICD